MGPEVHHFSREKNGERLNNLHAGRFHTVSKTYRAVTLYWGASFVTRTKKLMTPSLTSGIFNPGSDGDVDDIAVDDNVDGNMDSCDMLMTVETMSMREMTHLIMTVSLILLVIALA